MTTALVLGGVAEECPPPFPPLSFPIFPMYKIVPNFASPLDFSDLHPFSSCLCT